MVTTKTWTLAITKGLTDRVSRSPKDPIFSFRANKCHFFFCRARSHNIQLNRVRKQHTAPKSLSSGKFSRVSLP